MTDMMLRTLAALSDPHRIRIVELLRERPRTVNEVAQASGLRQPQTSKHLKVLSEAGIVKAEIQGNRRLYRLTKDPFRVLETWAASFSDSMGERFDRLDSYLSEMKQERGNQNESTENGDTDGRNRPHP